MLFISDLRRTYFILLNCIPSIVELVLLYLTLLGIFARVGYHIFTYSGTEKIYQKDDFLNGTGIYYRYLEGNHTDPHYFDYESIWDAFSTFFYSSTTLFVLLTTENYPEVLWPAWMAGHEYWSYFSVYILISTFFMMNLFTASVYNAYETIINRLDVDTSNN